MSDLKSQTRYTGVDRRTPRVQPGMAAVGAASVRTGYKPAGRHSAITNSLYSLHSYKNWADKIRGSWEEPK